MFNRIRQSRATKACAVLMTAAVFSLSTAITTYGGMVPSQLQSPGVESASQRQADMQTIQKALESKLVINRLAKLGYSAAEAQARLDRLSDEQISTAAMQIDQVETGGVAGLLVAGLLVVLILVLLDEVDL